MRIQISGLWYRYAPVGHDVLRNISLELGTGSFCCILGPNGSGKTTLLKLMAGLLPTDHRLRGALTLDGKPLTQWRHPRERRALARALAYVPAFLRTDFPLSVADFVAQGRYAHSSLWTSAPAVNDPAVREALATVNLTEMAAMPLMHLSTGERQLALIARAVAQKPQLLLLDESLSNLDLNYQLLVLKVLKNLNAGGMGVVLVSHDLNLASEFCPQAVWMRHGEVTAAGALKDTFTETTLHRHYPAHDLTVGPNPHTGAPKVFFKPHM